MRQKCQVPHTRHCKQFEQTPIKKIDPKKISESFIRKIQKSSIIGRGLPHPPEYKGKLPKDANTIPLRKEKDGYRYLSRSEAIRRIETDELILHRGELVKRDAFVEKILKEAFNCEKYFVTSHSSFIFFLSCEFYQNLKKTYSLLTRKINRAFNIKICSGCLFESKYIWREADLIQRYIEAAK